MPGLCNLYSTFPPQSCLSRSPKEAVQGALVTTLTEEGEGTFCREESHFLAQSRHTRCARKRGAPSLQLCKEASWGCLALKNLQTKRTSNLSFSPFSQKCTPTREKVDPTARRVYRNGSYQQQLSVETTTKKITSMFCLCPSYCPSWTDWQLVALAKTTLARCQRELPDATRMLLKILTALFRNKNTL